MRNLTLKGRIVVFSCNSWYLAISEIVFVAHLTKIPNPSGQRIRENTKIFSLEKLYSKNKIWNNL